MALVGEEREEGVDEGDGFGRGLVHLPVGGYEWFTHLYQYSIL